MASRVLRLLFVVYVAATAAHIAYVMAHEPFSFDAWNMAADTRAQPFSLENFFDYGIGQYTHSNPRIGQWFAYLAYKLELFAVIATPIAFLGLVLAVTVIGLGRWPSWRSGRDLALMTVAIGFAWFAIPRIGMIMFCRSYGTNYLYGATIQLWFLVPLALRPRGEGALPACIAYFVLGVIAGMCNEHTGPTLVVFALGYAVWRQRRAVVRPNLAWAGALGAVVGFAAIFFAPGQGERYDGLANRVSFVGRLLQRGLDVNLDIFRDFVVGSAPLLGMLVIAFVIGREQIDRSRPLRLVAVALAAGTLITITVFVSPKLGPRFYLHGCALLLAGFIAVAETTLVTTRRLVPFVVLAVFTSGFAAYRTIPLYERLARSSDERLAALAASPIGSSFTAAAFDQVNDSWWFLGDDFRDIRKRELVRDYFALRGVVLRGVDIDAPLGVSDVRLVPQYQLEPASCLDQAGGLELDDFRGIDILQVHKAIRGAVDTLRVKLAGRGTIAKLDVTVGFVGDPPPLPRKTLVVARATANRVEAYSATIRRLGAGKTRRVLLPPELKGKDFEYLIYNVGGEARRLGPALEYIPWHRGAYWALACRPEECFVIAAARLQ
ncbi:MAG TPA: DUF6056 family protein [Kofleriaceae bacterium]